MRDEDWKEVLEKCHRKNLNKLYLKLKKGEPLEFTKIEREHLCNALMWAGEEINYSHREMNRMIEYEGYRLGDSLPCLAWQID